jgi:HD-GYP domain-containing protein (c-di-GMP phosphodiesterase class II)
VSKHSRYLKPSRAKRLLELALPLLPPGVQVQLWLDDQCQVSLGEPPGADYEIQSFPLVLEGQTIGALRLEFTHQDPEHIRLWGNAQIYALQDMLDTGYARRAVGQETLESYREMALLQRAVLELNHSLKPSAVVETLLAEFKNQQTHYGAVYLFDEQNHLHLAHGFGEDATAALTRFAQSALFESMRSHTTGDIFNDPQALEAAGLPGVLALLWLPLAVPEQPLGLLVLASNDSDGFHAGNMKRARTLCSVAATALHNAKLYVEQHELFLSFVRVIANTIDAKSPYMAGHCRRVPDIAMMLAEAAHQSNTGAFADFHLDDNQREVIQLAAMLHDCGKIITPEWVTDKSTKLDGVFNGLELVRMRFEVLRHHEVLVFHRDLAAGADPAVAQATHQAHLDQLDADLAFLEHCNLGTEFLTDEQLIRLQAIAQGRWCTAQGEEQPLLTEQELHNLSTRVGTLNAEERQMIQDHAVHTFNILSEIRFPPTLRAIIDYAANHHERMDGSGYPRGLDEQQLSIPERIMAIADIFEALTAPDRPYRQELRPLSWAIAIMYRMKCNHHIDADLFDLFLSQKIYLNYAERYLNQHQIDLVEIERYLGSAA